MSIVRSQSKNPIRSFLLRTIAAQSHLIACFAAIWGLVVLMQFAIEMPGSKHFWACLMFGITGILVFATSSIYHFLSDGFRISPKWERWLEDLDHFAIYLFIAGTYTPFLINALDKPWSAILLTMVWVSGGLGIVYTHFKPQMPKWMQHRAVYTGIFVLMGLAFILRVGEIFHHLHLNSILLLVAGGASYIVGAVIYAMKRPRLFSGIFGYHELWHVMVMVGFGFHYFMILGFYN